MITDYPVVGADPLAGDIAWVNLIEATEQLPEYLRLVEDAVTAQSRADAFVAQNPGIKGLLEFLSTNAKSS